MTVTVMNQSLNIRETLKRLARMKREGAAFHEGLAARSESRELSVSASAIAREERRQERCFRDLAYALRKRETLPHSDPQNTADLERIISLLRRRNHFHPQQVGETTGFPDEDDAVEIAILYKKVSVKLLSQCREISHGLTRRFVEKFIERESFHLRTLEGIRCRLLSRT